MIVKGDNNKFSRGLQGKAENSSIRRLSREHGYTLYVQNIPQAMQWKGLWHGSLAEVEENLVLDKNVQGNSNGNAHENSSDRNIPAQMNQDKPLNRDKDCVKEGEFVNQEKAKQARKTYKRIQGHVVDEELWELKRSLVGVMAMNCEKVIEVEVGNLISKVRVKELGFTDDSPVLPEAKSSLRMEEDKGESFSGFQFQSSVKSDRSRTQVEEEAMGAIFLGKDINNEDVLIREKGGKQLEEIDMLGSTPLKGSAVNEEALKENATVEYQGVSRVTAGMEVKHSWAEIISKNLETDGKDFVSPFEVMGHISPRPLRLDLQSSRIGSKLSPVKGKFSWAASVDAKMNADYIKRGDANTDNFALIGKVFPGAFIGRLVLAILKGVVIYHNVDKTSMFDDALTCC
ncbi:hypothetical protein V6N11_007388 [Hibiscus sabdariffa]|uniref:Uncharacterized protein n=2 Tax=Hibiscus sabdariffa TaxID=183260 RepID=A0ABR1ZBQ3_9ROSI